MLIIEKSFSFLLWLSNILLSLVFISAWFSIGYQTHLVVASVATLLSLFVQVSTLFYFIGSGRWIKDRAEEILPHDKAKAFRIWQIYEKANKLKAGPMPFATFGIFFGIFSFILGGALQVGAVSAWVHITLASLFVLNNWTGHYFTLKAMKRNLEYLDLTSKEIDLELRTQQ